MSGDGWTGSASQGDARGARGPRGREPLDHPADGQDGEAADLGGQPSLGSRYDAFRKLAEARAAGEVVALPRTQVGHDRRLHVRQTIREDHQRRITDGSLEAREKFDKLAGSLFSFFRGTALLFYRDMPGEDAWMPTVLTLGDVHPENFGVMPSADNVPFFGVNDFDEAYYAPFTWDVKRGAVGFMIAAQEEGDHGSSRQRKIAEAFVRGYLDGISHFDETGHEVSYQMRQDNAPDLIRDLIKDAKDDRSSWLADDYHDEYRQGFKSSKKLVPVSSRVKEFQEVVAAFVAGRQNGDRPIPARGGKMRVKDVAIRKGQGTASLGLDRYYVMIEGPRADGTDDLVVEFKQARRSALAGLAPPSDVGVRWAGEAADRIAHAQRVQLVNGDPFYGYAEIDGVSFMTRERSPFRDDIDLDDLSKSQWSDYARICGGVLAHAHALSDEVGEIDHDIEPQILDAVGAQDLFVQDMIEFAAEASDRVRADWEHFKADHSCGAFRRVDVVYR